MVFEPGNSYMYVYTVGAFSVTSPVIRQIGSFTYETNFHMKVCTTCRPHFETEVTGNSEIAHYAEAQAFVLPFVNEISLTGLTRLGLRDSYLSLT